MPLGANKAAIMGVAGTAAAADVVFITSNASDTTDLTSIDFTSGIDSTYGEYIFHFYNINPATDDVSLQFQVNATDGADYNDSNITSTTFEARDDEGNTVNTMQYVAGADLANAADAFQTLMGNIGSGGDESVSGWLHLFNPSSTTYAKHFIAETSANTYNNTIVHFFTAGYINDTTAIDDIQFKMSSGNFDGTIKMWGVK